MLIGPWAAIGRPGKSTISSYSKPWTPPRTNSPDPILQAIPGLKRGLHCGVTLFCAEVCLPPAAINHIVHSDHAAHAEECLQAPSKLPSTLPQPPSYADRRSKSEGAKGQCLACQRHPKHAHTRPAQKSTPAWPQLCSKIRVGTRHREKSGSGSKRF
ncbi:uncharacterized protein LOC104673568 [Rhinopithecus roxellana]|uniref:uncharacterized protein LOC104673568 n=1 Tax=Rhinopithecus roxellana TaxID=61622 RepID=UPI0005332168|nr:uncharacterized protein LOC104673568 [Rhinopithecus roxellana]